MTDDQESKRQTDDQAEVDRWLRTNLGFGVIVALGLVVMAVIGATRSGVTQQAGMGSSSAEAGSAATPSLER